MSIYDPLARWLEKQPAQTRRFTTPFAVLEGILKRQLPPSARRHLAWWANDDNHTQARAWATAGWQVGSVDLMTERVTFLRQSAGSAPARTDESDESPAGTVALVACVKTKRNAPAPARDLYTSPLFVGARAYAERNADRWFILSARHGLLDPDEVIPPYEQALATMSEDERRSWAERVLTQLGEALAPGERVIMLAGRTYRDPLMTPLDSRGHEIEVPMAGKPYDEQVRWLQEQMQSPTSGSADHLERFYELLHDLERRLGGRRLLSETHGGMDWPERAVEFFFEPGELRSDGQTPRVVRIGTHAVTANSRATFWSRLSQHRGPASGVGNHRGSVFRKHVGTALLARSESSSFATWGQGSTASKEVREQEREHEQAVSRYLGGMPLLWLPIEDAAGPESDRSLIRRHVIALLSGEGRRADPPSANWLGRWSRASNIRNSGLWNVENVGEPYDPGFLDVFERHVRAAG